MSVLPSWEMGPLPRPLDPVLVFSHLSQPTSNRGHPPKRTKSPLVPSMCVHSQHAIQRPQSSTLHICTNAHTHVHTYTMPITIPSYIVDPLWEYGKGPHLSGVSLASPALLPPSLQPLSAPSEPAWYLVLGSLVLCVGRVGGREVQRRVKEWERGSERGRYKIKR